MRNSAQAASGKALQTLRSDRSSPPPRLQPPTALNLVGGRGRAASASGGTRVSGPAGAKAGAREQHRESRQAGRAAVAQQHGGVAAAWRAARLTSPGPRCARLRCTAGCLKGVEWHRGLLVFVVNDNLRTTARQRGEAAPPHRVPAVRSKRLRGASLEGRERSLRARPRARPTKEPLVRHG